ncbi:MAG: hypothetical protein ABSG45_04300 [Nitrososphaerales archaeon]
MKARGTIVLALVISLALVPILTSVPVRAQGQYTERLDVYVAGTNAYWLMSMNRLNSTLPNLSSAESTAGLNSYRLLALSTQSAVSDFQIFGVDGYNLLKVPSLPSQGLFLTVNASSSSAASPIVSYFATRFATTFTLVSSGSGSYVYYAPVNFAGVAAPVLYRLVPTTMKGFAAFVTESSFVGLAMPSIAVTGVNNGSGFSHSITVGAASSSITSSSGTISIPQILSNASGALAASSSASSSEVVIHSLDGVILSSDKATVSNDASNLSGTYTLSPAAGATVKVNATITSQSPTAIAYRLFDRGTLTTNQSLAVTIVLKDTAQSGAIQNVTVNDNWWKSYPSVFQFESGNYSFTVPIIAAGQNVTYSYALKVVSASSAQVTVPSASVGFRYVLSSTSYSGEAFLNQAVLQVNNVGPALSIVARSTISSGAPLGTAGNYTITLTNAGNSPALNIKVGSRSITNLAQGSSQTLNVPVLLSNLIQRNFTKTFWVQFTSAAQQTQNITSNSVSVLLSHSQMVLPFIQLSTNDTLTSSSITSRVLNVTYSFANKGTGTSGSVTGTQVLPAGVSCRVVKGGNSTCTTGAYTMQVARITTQSTQVNTVELGYPEDNFIIQPVVITTSYDGATLHTFGGAYVIPAGIVLTKSFGPKAGFPGMTSSVSLGISNAGSNPVSNATVSSSEDSFDSVASGATTVKTYATLVSQQSESFNYSVTFSNGASGNVSSSPASVSLIIGGLSTGFSSAPAHVQVFKPVAVTLVTSPLTPEENHDFTLSVTFTNGANVAVSAATYTFTMPSGLTVVSGGQVSGRTVTVSVPTIGADSNQTEVLKLSSTTGLTIDTATSHVTYQYQGFSLNGLAPKQTITVAVDVTTRYTLPIIIAVFIAIAGLVYMRRRINPAVEA